jgi:UDP-N-acetylglucosamine 4,6-dehydratase/5-epimerase
MLKDMFKNSTILITGGTGSFGSKFIPMTLKKFNPKKIIVYSRDEIKQWEMQNLYKNHKKIRFFIGDIRDKERLFRALDGVDYVVHAAASKIVPTAEYNPFEAIKTNINGAMNLIDACIDRKVKKIVALSTDKACNPANLYGATKLASDKLFIAGNYYSSKTATKFSVVRYGNVMGSRGSVIPFFMEQAKSGVITVTDKRMTRFMISLEDAVQQVWTAFENMQGGEIFIKKIPSMNIKDIAKAVSEKAKIKYIGIRPGEKIHELMISESDSMYTYEFKDYYIIVSQGKKYNFKNIKKYTKVDENFEYSSDNNLDWMDIKNLRNWIKKNY